MDFLTTHVTYETVRVFRDYAHANEINGYYKQSLLCLESVIESIVNRKTETKNLLVKTDMVHWLH